MHWHVGDALPMYILICALTNTMQASWQKSKKVGHIGLVQLHHNMEYLNLQDQFVQKLNIRVNWDTFWSILIDIINICFLGDGVSVVTRNCGYEHIHKPGESCDKSSVSWIDVESCETCLEDGCNGIWLLQ